MTRNESRTNEQDSYYFQYFTEFMNDLSSSCFRESRKTARGMVYRGYAYEHGMAGVKKDKKEAVVWYQKAAEVGDTYAMFALGDAYANGSGIDQDKEKALDWYRKAASIDRIWPQASDDIDERTSGK